MGFTLGILSLLKAQDNVMQLKEKIIDLQTQGELGFRNFTLCTNPVLDLYASNSLELGNLPPGTYQFKAVIHGKLKNKESSHTYTFKIVQLVLKS